MPRIYKGTTAKLALMYYPCVINPSDVSELTIAIYSEGTNEAIEYSLADITLKDNIAFINLAKYQLDVLDNGVIKYVARGVYKGNDFVQDRYSNYYVQTPKDYEVEDVAIQNIKRVDVSELITNVLPDSGYDGMGEVVVDANPLINNVADNAVTLDVDKNGTYVAELADNYKGYIKEINVSVPSVNVEQLTQEEYDNITPEQDTLYVITDAPEIEIPDTSEFVTNSELADKNYVDIYYLDNKNYATNDSVNDTYNFLVEQLNEIFPQYAEKQWVEDKGYLTEDELQNILKEYNTIPYIVVDGFSSSGFEITKGDWDAVHNAIQNNNPYLIYARSSDIGEIFSLVDDIVPYPQGGASIATTLIVAKKNVTYRAWNIDINGNVELELEEKYAIPTEFKTINGNEITGTGDIIIEGGNGNVVELTQEEYNSITHDKETLYLITDATPEYNLKTINGNDIVGKGDIKVEASVDLSGYATEQWVDDKGYLKEIPSEYITETELNEALANIGGGSDIPSVVIKYANPSFDILSGDLDAVVNAIKNNKPYLAYFYNTYSTYGQNRWLYQFTLCYADNTSFSLSYHTEFGSVHKDISINGKFDSATQKYTLTTIGAANHNYLTSIPDEYITETELSDKNYVDTSYLNGELEGYAKLSYVDDALANVGGGNGNIVELTQEEYDNITPDEETLYLISDVAPKENLKTINGESIIGTGDIVIETNVDLTGYATEQWVEDKEYAKLSYVDEQLGNINTILENILN